MQDLRTIEGRMKWMRVGRKALKDTFVTVFLVLFFSILGVIGLLSFWSFLAFVFVR